MAYVQTRTATVGELITSTFDVISASRREIAFYLLVFGGMGLLAGIEIVGELISTLSFFAYFAAQYWLCRSMLQNIGLTHHDRFRVISFFAMALLLGFVIYFGFSLFFVPGILLGAKWVMAPTYLVSRDTNLFEAIGASWRASDGNTLSLSLAYTAIGGIGLAFFWLVLTLSSAVNGVALADSDLITGPIEGLFFSLSLNLLPIMLMALSVAAYRLLSDQTQSLVEVFE